MPRATAGVRRHGPGREEAHTNINQAQRYDTHHYNGNIGAYNRTHYIVIGHALL